MSTGTTGPLHCAQDPEPRSVPTAAVLAATAFVGLAGSIDARGIHTFALTSARPPGNRAQHHDDDQDVITVAFGSTLATILLSSSVSWAEGAAALGGLAVLQLLVAWATSGCRPLRHLVTSEPTPLVRDGRLLQDAMNRQRVAVADVRQALRSSGLGDLSQVAAVVLETDGSISVIGRDHGKTSDTGHWRMCLWRPP